MAAAVNLFNRAGCVQWVPYTNQPNYVEIIGSRKLLYVDHIKVQHGFDLHMYNVLLRKK